MQCTMGMFFKQRPDFIRSVLHVEERGEEITIFYNDILMRKIELRVFTIIKSKMNFSSLVP